MRALRLVAVVVLALVLLPYLIAPLYRFVNPSSTVMVWRWATGQRVERTVMPLNRIAPALPRAVVSAEDGSFCAHHGIDWRGLREAFTEADDIFEMRGGSTITQQVAKNLFLWQGRSFVRKALEAYFAVLLELFLTKERILEIYLNVAEFGPNVLGVEAAADSYFHTSASALDLDQAALLAAVLPNPQRLLAAKPSDYVRERQARIESEVRLLESRGHYRGIHW